MIDSTRYPRLSRIDNPARLREFPENELGEIAREVRDYLVQSVASSGGHFGAGLGVVELTVALHYLYDTPVDRIVWDVGHQCYPHKILTGRRDRITTVKKKDGLAPFPRREESEYDTFGVGHSSTSISAALGMAIAAQRKGDERKIVAVIGDGAMTAGMAYEALNHGGDVKPDMLVILNDNQMSISENVGALTQMLARLMSSRTLNRMRESGKKMMKREGFLWRFLKRWEEHAKGMFMPSTLFEELGFHYTGPIDGHDIPQLVGALRTLKELKGPQLLHVITTKGKGYARAEREQIDYHAVGPFDPDKGLAKKGAAKPTYTEIFGDWLCDQAAADPTLYAITPAMREGSGLVRFSKAWPSRYFDVGIAEQHAVTLGAGMACEGAKPVVAIYSTFLQRAYDQLIHDVALQNLDVLFAIDRGGLVGPDGATHSGSFDLSYLRCIPNMVVMAPADERECRQMLSTGFQYQGPAAVRYPRGSGPGVAVDDDLARLVFLQPADAAARPSCAARDRASPCSPSARCLLRLQRSPKRWTRPWSTCASSNRWTRPWSSNSRAAMPPSSPSRTMRSPAAPGPASANCWPPEASSCRSCTSASPTAISNTPAARNCWPNRVSIRPVSRLRSAHAARTTSRLRFPAP